MKTKENFLYYENYEIETSQIKFVEGKINLAMIYLALLMSCQVREKSTQKFTLN
jgi:hypothetical protein